MSSSIVENLYTVFDHLHKLEASHLIELPGGEWSVWRWLGVRGAGFPLSEVLALASPLCSQAADSLARAQDNLSSARSRLLSVFKQQLKLASPDHRKLLSKAISRLKRGHRSSDLLLMLKDDSCEFLLACDEVERAEKVYERAFEEDRLRTSSAVRSFAQCDKFREALIWQNRKAFHTGVAPLLREPSNANCSSNRRKEELIGSYMQRYCTKNETIGFFGPVGWGRFVSNGPALSARPGSHLLARRQVFFEQWCIDALADCLASRPDFRPWLVPRLYPTVRLDGNRIIRPLEPDRVVTDAERTMLEACKGLLTSKKIADQLMSSTHSSFDSEHHIFDLLDSWHRDHIISLSPRLGMQLYPERTLREKLERIEDVALRDTALDALNSLEQGKNEIEQAAGDPDRLDLALEHLEDRFTQLTGAAPTRFEGRTYAGRTLVYEDCRRDLDIELGPEFLARLGEPLSLLLQSVRWMTNEIASSYRKAFDQIYRELAFSSPSDSVEAIDFWSRAQRLIFGRRTSLVRDAVKKLQAGWGEVLRVDYTRRHLKYSSRDLSEKVKRVFAASDCGWRVGRYHSPDLMVAAQSVDAIRRGDYQIVLGEMHIGLNTLAAGSFVSQHPFPQQLFDSIASDLPDPRVMPAYPKARAGVNARTRYELITPKDYYFECSPKTLIADRSNVLSISDLIVLEGKRGLVVQARDGSVKFDILDFFGEKLSAISTNHFKILEAAPHIPRISFDHLVVSRESWSFPVSQFSFASELDPARRFLLARSWHNALSLPRFVFAKVPVEIKPLFVDFDSPMLINLLAKSVRRSIDQGKESDSITLSEMLPDPDQVWLPDGQGNRYSSELRIVAFDSAT